MDEMDFPMDFVGGKEPPLSYEERLDEITKLIGDKT